MPAYKDKDKSKIYEYMRTHPFCAVTGNMVPDDMEPHHYRHQVHRLLADIDGSWNLERLSGSIHREAHKIGIKKFAVKYGLMKPRLILVSLLKWTDADETEFRVNALSYGREYDYTYEFGRGNR